MSKIAVLTISKREGWEELAKQSIEKQTVQLDKWIVITDQDVKKIRASNLNRSLNYGLKQCLDVDYVIFYQDFIELQPDCFEKLIALADERTFVTTCTPNYDGSDDGRYTHVDGPRACLPAEWETNVAIAPMAVLRELGGFDEEYDNGWAWDNVNVAERAAMLGCRFIIDESNRPKLLPHEQTSKLELELNADRHAATMKAIREGKKPLRLSYL